MPEKTWIEHAKDILKLVEEYPLNGYREAEMILKVEAAKIMMQIALVEEIRKTNAILARRK